MHLSQNTLVSLLLAFGLCAGCEASSDTVGDADGSANTPATCVEDSNCAAGQVCVNDQCANTDTEFNCTSAGCPDDYTCMPTGLCQGNVECVSDDDCCSTDAECLLQCVNFHCVGDQCAVGEVKEC